MLVIGSVLPSRYTHRDKVPCEELEQTGHRKIKPLTWMQPRNTSRGHDSSCPKIPPRHRKVGWNCLDSAPVRTCPPLAKARDSSQDVLCEYDQEDESSDNEIRHHTSTEHHLFLRTCLPEQGLVVGHVCVIMRLLTTTNHVFTKLTTEDE